MIHIKLYENFDFNEDDFDFEEFDENNPLLTNEEFDKLLSDTNELFNNNQINLRIGQCYMISLQKINRKVYNKVIMSDFDPFYNKKAISNFLGYLNGTNQKEPKYSKRNENFDFNEDDFDFEEEKEGDFLNDFHNGKHIKVYRKDWEKFVIENSDFRWINGQKLDKSYMDVLEDEMEEYGVEYTEDLDNYINVDYVFIIKIKPGIYRNKKKNTYFITYEFDDVVPINSDKEFTLYENFDFNEDDFDFEEVSDIIIPDIINGNFRKFLERNDCLEKWFKNYNKYDIPNKKNVPLKNFLIGYRSSYINYAFRWRLSPEGYDYWMNIDKKWKEEEERNSIRY